jgi:hypothetical protein
MSLDEAQKKKLRDVAIGDIVNGKIPIVDQLAAIRKQLVAVSEALKVPLDKDFQALEDLVANEKVKKEEKEAPAKTKKTTKK